MKTNARVAAALLAAVAVPAFAGCSMSDSDEPSSEATDGFKCESGLLYEGINAWAELKKTATVESYKERARRALGWQ